MITVSTLLGNLKGLVELDSPNTCAEVKLFLFLFMPALEIVCRETEVLKQLILAKYKFICYKTFPYKYKETTISNYKEHNIHKVKLI